MRRTGKVGARAAPFTYCGELDIVSWEDEKPITVVWKRRDRVPERWFRELGVIGDNKSPGKR